MDPRVMEKLLAALRRMDIGGTVPTKEKQLQNEAAVAAINAPETKFQGEVDAATAAASAPEVNSVTQAKYGVNPLTQQDQLRELIAAEMRPAQLDALHQSHLAGWNANPDHNDVKRQLMLQRSLQQ